MVARLVTGILAGVFLVLGIAFLAVGGDFTVVGAAIVAAGVAFAAVFVVLTRKAAERRRRRRAGLRTDAEVVRAVLHPEIRMGALLTYDLTVRIVGSDVTNRVLVVPGTAVDPGASVPVQYDPAEPANFEVRR